MCGDAGAVKRAGFRLQWLSACGGSNPLPRISGLEIIYIHPNFSYLYLRQLLFKIPSQLTQFHCPNPEYTIICKHALKLSIYLTYILKISKSP